jgi:hypothetical protein
MLSMIDNLVCQVFHARWAEVVSYSRHGAWRCTKPGCAAQACHDRAHSSSCRRPVPQRTPLEMRRVGRIRHKRARAYPAA